VISISATQARRSACGSREREQPRATDYPRRALPTHNGFGVVGALR
jgi:hypothetical protein